MGETTGRADAIADAIADGRDTVRRRSAWMRGWYVPVTAVGLTLIAVVAVFRMESSGPDYDPQYMRVLVERAMRFGGSYYENGIHNKGPLEPIVYEVAARLGGGDGFWFVLGLFTLVVATVVGIAAGLATVRAGGPVVVASAVAAIAIVHLTLSEADYAGVLYARNLTTGLLCAAFAVAAFDPCWATPRRRLVAVVAIGIATGLAVQTLLTACFTATPVLIWAVWARRDVVVRGRPAWVVMPAVSALVLMSAPAWYLVVGPWRDFVDGWWVYARWMSTGTGRDLGDQFALGWDQFVGYYHDRPELVVVVQLWVVVTAFQWRQLDREGRALRAVVGLWWVGAWVELVLSQRYSSHYFSVLAVPTILMVAVLAGVAGRRLHGARERRPALAVLPLVAAIVTIQVGGRTPFDVGVEAAATVTSTADLAARREVGVSGRTVVVRAALDLVSEPGDPLLMWTSYPWPYLDLRRVSATRYIWKTFLMGEIYLGGSGPEYVLPGTWERFHADLAEADPTAFVVEAVNPVAPGTPFEQVVAADFRTVFDDGEITLAFRDDLAGWLLGPPDRATAPVGVDEVLPPCVRLDAEFDPGAHEPVRVALGTAAGPAGAIDVTASDGAVVAESTPRAGSNGYAGTFALPAGSTRLTLAIGARSAVLVLGGRIVGAVAIDPGTSVTLAGGTAALGPVTRSAMPAASGC